MKPALTIILIRMLACAAVLTGASAAALDHDNLDPNRPIGMEDAYPVPKGEIGLEGGVRFNDRRTGRTSVTFQPQIIYGAFDNTQIEIQGDLFTDPRSIVGANKSGDLHLGVLYNFNTETIMLPALALRVEADLRPASIRRGWIPRSPASSHARSDISGRTSMPGIP